MYLVTTVEYQNPYHSAVKIIMAHTKSGLKLLFYFFSKMWQHWTDFFTWHKFCFQNKVVAIVLVADGNDDGRKM